MNTPTPYEQLIAAKLDQVPVPDMADSIWASIDVQLGAGVGMSGEQPSTGAASPGQAKYFGKVIGKIWYGIVGVAAVVSAFILWWFFAHREHTPVNKAPQEQAPQKQTPQEHFPPTNEVTPKDRPVRPFNGKNEGPPPSDTLSLKHVLPNGAGFDSSFKQRPPLIKIDSLVPPGNRIIVPGADTVYMQPHHKGKGVKGIDSSDYQISAGKKN